MTKIDNNTCGDQVCFTEVSYLDLIFQRHYIVISSSFYDALRSSHDVQLSPYDVP